MLLYTIELYEESHRGFSRCRLLFLLVTLSSWTLHKKYDKMKCIKRSFESSCSYTLSSISSDYREIATVNCDTG